MNLPRLCSHCGQMFDAEVSRINRAVKIGAPLYCGRTCAGLARRLKNPPSDWERRAAKSAYDAARRERLGDQIRAEKRAYYYANRERFKAEHAAYRKAHMHRHVEYCRRPEYKAWKAAYDREHRAKKDFGEFFEAALLVADIDAEVSKRASKYEIYLTNGTINKAQTRRRAL